MGTSLSGLTPATTFDGLLKVGDNDPLTADLKAISTGDGTDTILSLSNSALQVNGQATIAGTGNNDTTTALLVQNSDGVQLLKMVNDGSSILGNDTHNVNIESNGYVNINSNRVYSTGSRFYYNDGNGYIARLDAAGFQVGNGASAAAATIHAKGSGATSATTSLLVQNSAGTDMLKVQDDGGVTLGTLSSNGGSILFKSASGSLTYGEISVNSGSGEMKIGATRNSFFPTFYSSGSEAMRINTSQFVGIGETTPTAKLHIKGSGNTSADYALKILNSDDSTLFDIRNDSVIRIAPNSTNAVSFRNAKMQDGNAVFGTTTIPASTRMTIKGQGATSATTALLVQNSAGTDVLKTLDNTQVSLTNNLYTFGTAVASFNRGLAVYGNILGNENAAIGSVSIPASTRAYIKGSGNDATTTALLVQNSDGDDMLKVLDNGQISASGDRLTIGDSADVTLRILASGNAAAGNNYIQPLGTPANQRVVVTGNSVATIKAVDLDASNVYIGYGINQTAATGTLSIKGSGATSATTALLVQNSAGTELLKVVDDGQLEIKSNSGRVSTTSGTSIFSYSSGGGGVLDVNPANGNSVKFRARGDNDTFLIQTNPAGDNVGIGASSPDSTAKLQVDSTSQGFLPPRMTDAERDAITNPAAGLMIYDTSNNQMNYWNGSTWIAF